MPFSPELESLADAGTLRRIDSPAPCDFEGYLARMHGRETTILWQAPPAASVDETDRTRFQIAQLNEAASKGRPVILVLGGEPSRAARPGIANAPLTLLLARGGMGGLFAALARLRGVVPTVCLARG